MEPTFREARITDCEAIGELKRRNGLLTEQWEWLWDGNPAIAAFPAGFPAGWVIEQGDNVVGYLGNVPMLYHLGGRVLLAAAARGFAVDLAFRSHSLKLAAAFLSQKNVHLLLNTSANVSTSKVFKALRASKIPQRDYDQAFIWVLHPVGFLTAFFQKRGLPRGVASVAGWAFAPALYAGIELGRRRPAAEGGEVKIIKVDPQHIAGEFDEFWQRTLRARPDCLLAERSAAVLRWRHGHPGAAARQFSIFMARRNESMIGYATFTREDSPDIGLLRCSLVDLIAEDDDEAVIRHLLTAGYEHARDSGCHVLEIKGFPTRIRNCFSAAGRPYTRTLPSWEFWYKAVAPDLIQPLSQTDCWYGSSFDGDAGL